MSTYSGLSTKTLERMRRGFEKKLRHKEAVMNRHRPGTAYHTAASRAAKTYRSRIATIDKELSKR